ncbi:lipopolysaccharide biosynthesis protein [Capnocytophaga sp.]|uniref:lipopolysaccharide biosynthesis protein n=1 Tax=Capnocytophaga sp. TaxID=44737 RepID=UPI0026DD5611|nr:lipopolysaccharide biosynthesis protein [Capnocytophaga sp.]MDO5104870.1 lipopolysaccharide biosynthesis protein [Capnocytophaga sp.]
MKDSQHISGSKVFSSFLWVLVEKFGYSGINLLCTLVLARLLTPYEFGLIGAVTIIISIANMIVESGMGAALINKKNVTQLHYNTMFTFNLLMSISLCAIIYLAAPYIASYFGKPILKDVVRVLSITLFFNALTIIQRVVLIKKLLFKKQSFISIASLSISASLAVLAAYNGWGVWAIVVQLVLYSVLFSVIIFFVIKYIPKLQFSLTAFKELLSFGGPVIASSAIQVTHNDIISSVIAKVYSIQTTGFYAQSEKLISFPTYIFRSLFDTAAFPILSKTKNRTEFKNICSRINRGVYFLAFPLLLTIPFNSEKIIHIVLGKQWSQACDIFTILSAGVIALLINVATFSVLKSSGQVKTLLNLGTAKALIGLALLACSVTFPIEILLYGIIFTNLTTSFMAIYYVHQTTLYNAKQQIKDIIEPLTIASLANVAAFTMIKTVHIEHEFINLLTYVGVVLVIVIVQCLLFNVEELKFIIQKVKRHKI